MSGRRLFGTETEYAVAGFDRDGLAWPRAALLERLFRGASRLVHLPATGDAGLFLSNGSRFYLDYGQHPEISGPECLNPWDAVRYSKAGDRIMVRLIDEVQRSEPALAEAVVLKGNVDYSGSHATWGAHESYCHRVDPDTLHRGLVPHLVSRVVYCGAGGFNPFSRGIEFMVSPRAAHISCPISGESTRDRGIIHTRNESLAAEGYRRQHVLCGESLHSDVGSWLRIGTTALVVAMVEAGVPCGGDVGLRAPVDALATFARDVSARRAVTTTGGRLTAIQIQRRYLHRAIEHVSAPWMPAWAAEVCAAWEQMLARLEQGPEAVSATLDWAIKLPIFRDRARRRGFDWDVLPAWTEVADVIEPARLAARVTAADGSKGLADADGPLRTALEAVRPLLKAHDLRLADLERFLALRQELFEVDVRFGQLGSRSVFEALDAQCLLDHAVPGVDRIDEAMEEPPAGGRAHWRGQGIRQAAGAGGRYSCSWEHVIDHQTEAYLDLSDPFVARPMWKMPPAAQAPRRPERRAAPSGPRPSEPRQPEAPAPEAPAPSTRHADEDIRVFSRLLARLRGARQGDETSERGRARGE
jgi:hypothetical protein